MRNYYDSLINGMAKLFVISLIFTQISGCSPTDNKGDLSAATSMKGTVATANNNEQINISAIYGSEYGHPNPRKSDISYSYLNLLISLFIFLPQDNVWHYVGGGHGDNPLLPRLIYNHTNWLLNPFSMYATRNDKGIPDLENKKTFSWEFDGKKRTIKIAEKIYPISAGDYVLVKLDKHWNPEVWVGDIGFKKLRISPETRNKILKCHITIQEGINSLGKCK